MRYLLLVLPFLAACQPQPDLVGHWHIEKVYPGHDGLTFKDNYTFDVINDTLAYERNNPPFWGEHPCFIDQGSQAIYWSSGCFTLDWSYRALSENELLVTNGYLDEGYQIKLLRKTDCSIETHLFMGSRLKVKLPETATEGVELDVPASTLRGYTIGSAAADYKKDYPRPYHYQLGDKIITERYAENLTLHEEQHRVKLPEAKRHLAKAVIFADAGLPASSLNQILNHTFAKPNDTLYFATLERGPDSTSLLYQPVQVAGESAPAELTVAAWLACE